MNDEIISTTFYKGREVITPSHFSIMVRGYPAYLHHIQKTDKSAPKLAVKRGKREYYYLDELLAWYEVVLDKRAEQMARTAERFAKAKELQALKRETNKESRKALLDTMRK
jgi:hypothetical protein